MQFYRRNYSWKGHRVAATSRLFRILESWDCHGLRFASTASPRRLFVGQCGDATADQLAGLFGPFAARGLRALHLLRKGCAMVLYERWAEGESPILGFNKAPYPIHTSLTLHPSTQIVRSTHGSRLHSLAAVRLCSQHCNACPCS